RPSPATPHVSQQPAVAGDRVGLQQAIQVLGLEVQALMPRIRQRILAVDGVEEPHGGVAARLDSATPSVGISPSPDLLDFAPMSDPGHPVPRPRVGMISLGCPKNLVDSE